MIDLKDIEKYRIMKGPMASTREDGFNGMFVIPKKSGGKLHFVVQISDGMGWEHASVSLVKKASTAFNRRVDRCPSWEEMCEVKDIFWDEDATVIQYHPAKKDYVNMHPNVLHLWRPVNEKLPKPDPLMVGVNLDDDNS